MTVSLVNYGHYHRASGTIAEVLVQVALVCPSNSAGLLYYAEDSENAVAVYFA